jgi:hypothetical protein
VHGLIPAEAAGGWSLGGSIMTFAIPVGLFLVVATALFFLYRRPPVAPGHRDLPPAWLAAPQGGEGGKPGGGQGIAGGQATAAPQDTAAENAEGEE